MAQINAPFAGPVVRRRPSKRRWNLLILAGLPLFALHIAMLVTRALDHSSVDALVVGRWLLAIGLLLILRKAGAQVRSPHAGPLALAAVLVFSLIHAPVAAPDPALPLAATGLGIALSVALVSPERASQVSPDQAVGFVPVDVPDAPFGACLETLKDRAPPALA